jgi:hypothetical protein
MSALTTAPCQCAGHRIIYFSACAHFKLRDVVVNEPETEEWPSGPCCTRCGEAEQVTKLESKKHRTRVYQCSGCCQRVTLMVGTVFARSKIRLHKWLLPTYLLSAKRERGCGHASRSLRDVVRFVACAVRRRAQKVAQRTREALLDTEMRTGIGHRHAHRNLDVSSL